MSSNFNALMTSLPKDRSFKPHRGDKSWGGFPLPSSSSQTIIGKQLVQGRYTMAWSKFEPATLQSQGTEHTSTPHCTYVNTYVRSKVCKTVCMHGLPCCYYYCCCVYMCACVYVCMCDAILSTAHHRRSQRIKSQPNTCLKTTNQKKLNLWKQPIGRS